MIPTDGMVTWKLRNKKGPGAMPGPKPRFSPVEVRLDKQVDGLNCHVALAAGVPTRPKTVFPPSQIVV